MPTKRKAQSIAITLRMGADIHETLAALVKLGLLGSTLDEVINHILREHLYREHMKITAAIVGAQKSAGK